jgi:hypothetical protein
MSRVAFALMLAVSSPAFAAGPVSISMELVADRVKSANYTVLENALRVYQAKEAVSVARGNLLPRLNLWRVAEVAYDPLALGGLIEDIAPFLVPSNWFRVEQQKSLHLIQSEAHRALWANEVMTAKVLYLQVLMDQALKEHLQGQVSAHQELLLIARTREALGGARAGLARSLENRLIELQGDARDLELLVWEEKSRLGALLGYEAAQELALQSVELPRLESMKPLQYETFEFRVLDTAPEHRQFVHLIRASDSMKRDIAFSVLGVSSLSRGAAGGVFDSIPVQEGLGFGTSASIRIGQAQKELLALQSRGVQETLRRQLQLLVRSFNSDVERYSELARRVELTRANLADLDFRSRVGEVLELETRLSAIRENFQAETAFFGIQYRFLIHQERLSRLLFHADYEKSPAELERLEGGK